VNEVNKSVDERSMDDRGENSEGRPTKRQKNDEEQISTPTKLNLIEINESVPQKSSVTSNSTNLTNSSNSTVTTSGSSKEISEHAISLDSSSKTAPPLKDPPKDSLKRSS